MTKGDGRVIPSSETQIIQSLEGGIIDKIFVKEGQQVKAGQILVQLRDIAASADLGENQAKYYGLLASVARLEAEASGKSVPEFPPEVMEKAPDSVQDEMSAFRANQLGIEGQVSVFRSQLTQKDGEVREITSRIEDLRRVIALSREKKAAIAPLVERARRRAWSCSISTARSRSANRNQQPVHVAAARAWCRRRDQCAHQGRHQPRARGRAGEIGADHDRGERAEAVRRRVAGPQDARRNPLAGRRHHPRT